MNINNAKSVNILGISYDIIRTSDVDKLGEGGEGRWSTQSSAVYIKKGLPESRISQIIWHETCHIIDFYVAIKKESCDMDENEVQRMASALQDLEFEYHDERNQTEGKC